MSMSGITFTCDNIPTIIKIFDADKVHGHDMISIGMLKLCSKSIS